MKQLLPIFTVFVFGALTQLTAQTTSGLEPEILNNRPFYKIGSNWFVLDNINQTLVQVGSAEITLKIDKTATTINYDFLESEYGMQLKRQSSSGWSDFNISNAQYSNLISFCNELQNLSFIQKVDVGTPLELLLQPNDSAFYDPVIQTYYQWNLIKAKVPQAWNKTTGSNNIITAIIDSGVEWFHEDFAQATGTTSNSSIWYNTGEDAWTDQNDPATGNGIDDDGNGFIDDWRGWNFVDNNNDVNDAGPHGTSVAGIIAGRTNNHVGVAGVAGGWGANAGNQIMIVKASKTDTNMAQITSLALDDAIEYAAKNGAHVINISLGVKSNFSAIDNAIALAYKRYKCFIVAASGNNNGTSFPVIYPANHPLVISVANSNINDVTQQTHTGLQLDIAAPGHQIPIMDPQGFGPYAIQTGSSFSSPLVGGTAGLMLSVNECLNNEEIGNILKVTADTVGGFNYNYDPDRPGHSLRMGYGRVDAKEAVDVAEAMRTNNADLYMKDRVNDFGYPNSYPFFYYFDNSPDIWVREFADGYTNQTHQSPEYDSLRPVWVYVKVRNKGCSASDGTERLKLYWSKGSSNASWPQNWDGTNPALGDLIQDIALPVIEAGRDTIFQIPWTIIPEVGELQWGTCLLARIESTNDPITVVPGYLAGDVYNNNNIAMRNLTVVDASPGKTNYVHNGNTYPHGKHMLVGVASEEDPGNGAVDIWLDVPEIFSGPSIVEAAEVTLKLGNRAWELFLQTDMGAHEGIEVAGEQLLYVSSPHARIKNLNFIPGERDTIYVGFSFLTDAMDEKKRFNYHISEHRGEEDDLLMGAMHFKISTEERVDFQADAGPDYVIQQNETANPMAADINEPATYNWYDGKDSLIYTGKHPNLQPAQSETYTLEVIADADLYKDYDEMRVLVNPYAINSLNPNPTTNDLTVQYDADEATSAYLMVFALTNPNASNNYTLNTQNTSITFSCASLSAGAYTVVLVCDGQIVASKNFTKI